MRLGPLWFDVILECMIRYKKFFRSFRSCKEMPEVVWSNLQAHHYREDLTRALDEDASESDVRTCTLALLSYLW